MNTHFETLKDCLPFGVNKFETRLLDELPDWGVAVKDVPLADALGVNILNTQVVLFRRKVTFAPNDCFLPGKKVDEENQQRRCKSGNLAYMLEMSLSASVLQCRDRMATKPLKSNNLFKCLLQREVN